MRKWPYPLIIYLCAEMVGGQRDTNVLLGDPELDCGENDITLSFETQEPFTGLAFVRGHVDDPECRSRPANEDGVRDTALKIKFTDCGVTRRLSDNPPGTFLNTTIVIAFHSEFLTKHDRVYKIQCYYMDMIRTFTRKINVTMDEPVMHSHAVPMPVCRYEILDGSPSGPLVTNATIGQMVYHKWTCDTNTTNIFCMTVHSCTVDDGNGDIVELIDDTGCAHDRYLLQNIEYISDLMAGKEAHVYKYADRENMLFHCEIAIRIKEPGQEYCEVPICPDPPRRRRSNGIITGVGVAEIDDEVEHSMIEHFVSSTGSGESYLNGIVSSNQDHICLSESGVALFSIVHLSSIFLSLIFLRRLYYKLNKYFCCRDG